MLHDYAAGGGARHVSHSPSRSDDLRFESYLRELPVARVISRFGSAEGTGRKIVSSAEISRIAKRFSTEESLSAAFGALSAEARSKCAEAYLFLSEGIGGEEMAGIGEELLDSFLVYAVRTGDAELSYRGFTEFEPVLRPHVAAVLGESHRERHRIQHSWHDPIHVVNDTVLTIMLVAQRRLQTTKSGALAKAAYTTARNLLHYGTAMWRKELHESVAMLVAYGEEHGLVRRYDDSVVVARAGLVAWLARAPLSNYRDIVSFCTARYRPWHWPLALDAFSGAGSEGNATWYRSDEEGRMHAGMRIGETLGLVAVAKSGGEHLFAARAESVDATDRDDISVQDITIMPDFSAIISQETHPAILHGFCEVGDLTGLDQVYRGTINREAIARSLTAGVAEKELVSRLTLWAAPANVIETVREWMHEYRRVGISDEQVVLTSDAALAGHLAELDQLRDSLVQIPAGGVLRIRAGREREVRRVLLSLGFDIRMPRVMSRNEMARAGDIIHARDGAEEQELVTSVERSTREKPQLSGGGKYGSELKELPPSDLDHVVDYAIIMGCQLRFEYEGSPSIKQGLYTIAPQSYSSGSEGAVEGQDVRTGTTKRFLRVRIKSIGVIEQ